nr:hypothetical protein [uncultured Flavobacterium sp.]
MNTTIKYCIALLFVLTTSVFYGQNRGIAYQALIFKPDAKKYPGVSHSNTPLVDTEVCLRFTFTDVRKNVEYQEIIKIRTDNYGLVNTTIGTGQQIDGYVASFDQITWANGRKMLMVELDVSGSCTTFDIISNEPFLTVPFAQTANTISGVVPIANGGTGATNSTDARLNLDLNNVNNTSDLNKPISIATQAALNGKENTSNKSTDGTLFSNSDIKFPTEKAVKTYVDNSSLFAKGLQGTPVSPNTPLVGQFLRFDGTNWTPESLSSILKTSTIEVDATAAQTQFTLPTNAIGVIAFYINGVRLPKDAISISEGSIIYNPVNNGNYTIIIQDRITYDYIF